MKRLLLCVLVCLCAVIQANALSMDYLAGKDASLSRFSSDERWQTDKNNSHLFYIVHAMLAKEQCVFVTPKELARASYSIRRKLAGHSHLTEVKVDHAYLLVLKNIVQDKERQRVITHWIRAGITPDLTALIIPPNVSLDALKPVMSIKDLARHQVQWLIQRPRQDL